MCPNCVLNQAGAWVWLGPGLVCLGFAALAGLFLWKARETGEFEGDEEDAKYHVFD